MLEKLLFPVGWQILIAAYLQDQKFKTSVVVYYNALQLLFGQIVENKNNSNTLTKKFPSLVLKL